MSIKITASASKPLNLRQVVKRALRLNIPSLQNGASLLVSSVKQVRITMAKKDKAKTTVKYIGGVNKDRIGGNCCGGIGRCTIGGCLSTGDQ